MLYLFISILKIIGIVLLSVLGVILFLALLLLFVPVRYMAVGSYNDSIRFEAKVSYLLHIISLKYSLSDNNLVIRFCGIRLDRLLKNRKSKPGKKENTKVSSKLEPTNAKADKDSSDSSNSNSNSNSNSKGSASSDGSASKSVDETREAVSLESTKEQSKKKKTSKDSNTDSIYQKFTYYVDILNSDMTRGAFKTCKKRIGRLIKSALPKKTRILVTYGLNNPYTTSQIMSVYNVFYTYLCKGLVLNPVYDDKTLVVSGYIKGRLTLAPILWNLLFVVIDKNCKDFYYTIKGQS